MRVERNIKLLAWHNFFTDFRLYAPLAILYFTKVSGSYVLGMSVFSVTMSSQALLEVPTGIFSDLVGRKRTLFYGSLAMLVGSIAYAIGFNYWWLVLGAVCEGSSRAFYSGNNDALLHDTLTQLGKREDYSETLGKLSSLFQVALALAALLGSIMASWSFAWVMWLSVISQVACWVISLQVTEPQVHEITESNSYRHFKEAGRLLISNARLRWIAAASILGSSAGEAIYLFNATFIATIWSVWAVGIQKFLANMGAFVSFLTAGKLIEKHGEYPVMFWSRLYGRITSLVAYFYPTFLSPLLLASHSLLYGSITVADSTLQQKEFSAKQRATMASLISLGHSLGTAGMTFLVGLLADVFGPIKALLVMQIPQTIPLLIYWRLWRPK
jgi:MFS family permease